MQGDPAPDRPAGAGRWLCRILCGLLQGGAKTGFAGLQAGERGTDFAEFIGRAEVLHGAIRVWCYLVSMAQDR